MPEPTISRRQAFAVFGVFSAAIAIDFESRTVGASLARADPVAKLQPVDLVFAHSKLSGTFGDQRMALTFPLTADVIHGSVAGDPTKVQLKTGNNASSLDVPASLTGTFNKEPVSVRGSFHLASNYLFESGTVSGAVGEAGVSAQVVPISGETTSSIAVDGSYGATKLHIRASISGDLSFGQIVGTVGDHLVHLLARQSRGTHRITGTYGGPPGLLALMVGGLLYFL